MRDYSEHHAATYHFPGEEPPPRPPPHTMYMSALLTTTSSMRTDAYYGQNTKIRDTLNNLLLKSPQNWQTTIGLPFFRIEGTVVEWDVNIQ